VALPDGHEDVDPSFTHYAANVLPKRLRDGVDLTVIAGRAFGLQSPVAALFPTLYVDARLDAGAGLAIPGDHVERAVYVVEGALTMDETPINAGELAVLEPGAEPTLRAGGAARAMLLGGERFPTPRHIWWNFVASSRERIEAAKERWSNREFAPVPGETEFIPLPHE
jgi:redox-sensitive bicupin YhaK (pirin superfamily)